MNPDQLQAQATQAAQQGQAAYQSDVAKQNQYQGEYGTYQGQAGEANKNLQSYTDYMKNAGSGTNLYNTALGQAQQQVGFDPSVLATSTQNLIRSQNALNSLQSAAMTGNSGFGMSANQMGNYYATQATPLSNQVQAQNTAVGGLQKLYENTLSQAQQSAGLGLQGEQYTSQNLTQVFQNAQSQAQQALSQMQFYSDLARQQGGMNGQVAQYYTASLAAYRAAQQSAQQAALIGKQIQQQQLQNQITQAQMGSKAYKDALNGAPAAGKNTASAGASTINANTPVLGGLQNILGGAAYNAGNAIGPAAGNLFSSIGSGVNNLFGRGQAQQQFAQQYPQGLR